MHATLTWAVLCLSDDEDGRAIFWEPLRCDSFDLAMGQAQECARAYPGRDFTVVPVVRCD